MNLQRLDVVLAWVDAVAADVAPVVVVAAPCTVVVVAAPCTVSLAALE